MLTRLRVANFKRFDEIEVELGNPVVLIGPNDSGKTTALQALALWEIGLRRWNEKRRGKPAPEKRPGVTINRRDLIAVPVPDAKFLWRDLYVRNVQAAPSGQRTQNIRIDIVVDGVTRDEAWTCGFEFDYANEESFYCRPLRQPIDATMERMPVPEAASETRIAFLPPMSGLAANETRLDPGAINVRLGEGRTAEVLRNLCYQVLTGKEGERRWIHLSEMMSELFGVKLDEPRYVPERGEIEMTYKDAAGIHLALSSAGRGMQQTLLLLAHLSLNPGTILLLDEPDAHLEILRQRQIYRVLTDTARELGSQVIAASHSEVVLAEAADRDVVIAFVGKPHRIDDRGSQVLKALKEIGFDQYYQAELTGCVLYLEGSTDLSILQKLSQLIMHPARDVLQRPFVHYVANQHQQAYHHFYGLREAKNDLVGYLLLDRVDAKLEEKPGLTQRKWKRREIESYLVSRRTLVAWAEGTAEGPLFIAPRVEAMQAAIDEVEQAMATLGKGSPWDADSKVSDDFLTPLFASFYRRLGLPNLMNKADFHELALFVPPDELDAEVTETLDEIKKVFDSAKWRE